MFEKNKQTNNSKTQTHCSDQVRHLFKGKSFLCWLPMNRISEISSRDQPHFSQRCPPGRFSGQCNLIWSVGAISVLCWPSAWHGRCRERERLENSSLANNRTDFCTRSCVFGKNNIFNSPWNAVPIRQELAFVQQLFFAFFVNHLLTLCWEIKKSTA